MRRMIAVVLMAMAPAWPVVSAAQDYAMPGGTRDFRVESQTVNGRRGPVLSGYVYNDAGTYADRVQLLIEGVDGATVTSSTVEWVGGVVPAGSRRYFEIQLKGPQAPAYRVRVVTYELVGRGGV